MTKRILSILLALLLTSSLLASCNDDNDGNDTTDVDPSISQSDDTTGDDETEPVSDDPVSPDDESTTGGDSDELLDTVTSFLKDDVYPNVTASLPSMLEVWELDLTNTDNIRHNTGLTDLTGITNIIISESGISSVAYSLLYVTTDGTNTDEIQAALGENAPVRKWICVGAEKVSTIRLDNDIILVMGKPEQVDDIMSVIQTAADGVYTNIGDVVAAMG